MTMLVAVGLAVAVSSCGDDAVDGDPVDSTESSESTESSGATGSTVELEMDERVDAVGDALAAGDFTTMLNLLELTGLSDELEGREVTVLAPSEDAFADLSADDLSELLTDVDRAEALLRRHIIDGLFTYEQLAEATEVESISGEVLAISGDAGSLQVGGASVTAPSVDALAGEEGQEVAVLGIDQLLLDGE